MLGLPVLDELLGDPLGLVDGDREADADAAGLTAAAAQAGDGGVDADEATGRVDERAPELPGLTAAEVWIAEVTTWLDCCCCCWPKGSCCSLSVELVVTGRSRALTMPVVTVPERPRGLPTAMTGSPTSRPEEEPTVIGCRSSGGSSRVSTARSVEASSPAMLAR